MSLSQQFRSQILNELQLLYGDRAEAVLHRIDDLSDRFEGPRESNRGSLWNERSVVLITYGDQVRGEGEAALEAQRQFLLDFELNAVINTLHILPFFPYSSDDGFSVIDHRHVDPNVGNWSDVDRLGDSFGMVFDFVVNHCSQHNAWFQGYLQGEEPYTDYFIDVDPSADLTAVTRPRSTPVLTPYQTHDGTKHIWTTFSADQIDLNFASPHVLLEVLDILLLYIQHGAIVIRLDAIGFLWKRIGTTCMHLPETHTVIRLMRALIDDLAPGTLLLTETNVPHEENIRYFGDGDEAHAVYQFSLAPLLLDAFLSGDAGPLNRWLSSLQYPDKGMTFFNFTASHDGIGVRPLEGLVSQAHIGALIESIRRRGGLVSMRKEPDGTNSPYELNITYLSAIDSLEGMPPEDHARKFLTSQGVMLSLRGVPAIYFHSLVGTTNDTAGVQQTGHHRTINRRKFDSHELRHILADSNSVQRKVFDGYRHMLAVRIAQPAFHPDAEQRILDTGHKSLIAFTRISQDGTQRIHVLANVGEATVRVDLSTFTTDKLERNLLDDQPVIGTEVEIGPFEIAWLV